MNRKPLRASVRIRRCSSPLSPIALRTALIWLVRVDSETIRPPHTALQQIVLADDALAVAHQVDQQVEDLRPDRNNLGPPGELPPVRVKHAVSEHKMHFGAPCPPGADVGRAAGAGILPWPAAPGKPLMAQRGRRRPRGRPPPGQRRDRRPFGQISKAGTTAMQGCRKVFRPSLRALSTHTDVIDERHGERT